MHLIKYDLNQICPMPAAALCEAYRIDPARIFDTAYVKSRIPVTEHSQYGDALDFMVTGYIARTAQTFVFNSAQVLQFLRAVDRVLPPGDYSPPFQDMIIQFTEPIPEKLFLTGAQPDGYKHNTADEIKMMSEELGLEFKQVADSQDDTVLGLVMGFPKNDSTDVISITAYFASTAINRASANVQGDGRVTYSPMGQGMAAGQADKQRIFNLGMLCLAYMNTPGMFIERISTPEAINRKREAKGKRRLDDYYVCHWDRNQVRYTGGTGQGDKSVSFRFDVIGHFRRLPDGKMTWVRPHQRGLEHETYKPKVYRVD